MNSQSHGERIRVDVLGFLRFFFFFNEIYLIIRALGVRLLASSVQVFAPTASVFSSL